MELKKGINEQFHSGFYLDFMQNFQRLLENYIFDFTKLGNTES